MCVFIKKFKKLSICYQVSYVTMAMNVFPLNVVWYEEEQWKLSSTEKLPLNLKFYIVTEDKFELKGRSKKALSLSFPKAQYHYYFFS